MNKINQFLNSKDEFKHAVFFNITKRIRQLSTQLSNNNKELNDKLISIYINNNKTLDTIINFAILIKNRLNQKLLTGAINTINEIDNERLKEAPDPIILNKLNSEREVIESILKEEIDESINIVNNHKNIISEQKDHLNKLILEEDIKYLISIEEKNAIEVNEKILCSKEKISTLKEQINIITKSEDIINNENIIETFNTGIPSKEAISTLNIDKSEKDILKVLIDMLSNLFSQLDKGFTYQKLIETRHQLVEDYLTEIKFLTTLENQNRIIIFTLTHYHSLTNIECYLNALREQLTLLEQYWQLLVYQLTQLKNNILDTNIVITPHLFFLDQFLNEH